MAKKRLYLDVETTGPVKLIHGIYQIAGLIEIDNKIVEEFTFRIKPFGSDAIDKEALDVCGVDEDYVFSGMDTYRGFDALNDTLTGASERYLPGKKFTVVGYNVHFDVDFVQKFFIKNDSNTFHIIQNWKPVDVLALVRLLCDWGDRELNRLGNHKLSTLCNHFGIKLNAHDARSDIKATYLLYRVLVKRLTDKLRGGGK